MKNLLAAIAALTLGLVMCLALPSSQVLAQGSGGSMPPNLSVTIPGLADPTYNNNRRDQSAAIRTLEPPSPERVIGRWITHDFGAVSPTIIITEVVNGRVRGTVDTKRHVRDPSRNLGAARGNASERALSWEPVHYVFGDTEEAGKAIGTYDGQTLRIVFFPYGSTYNFTVTGTELVGPYTNGENSAWNKDKVTYHR